jgi:hypothetical protein
MPKHNSYADFEQHDWASISQSRLAPPAETGRYAIVRLRLRFKVMLHEQQLAELIWCNDVTATQNGLQLNMEVCGRLTQERKMEVCGRLTQERKMEV